VLGRSDGWDEFLPSLPPYRLPAFLAMGRPPLLRPVNDSPSQKITREAAEAVPDEAAPQSGPGHAEVSPYLAGEVIGDRYRLVREIGSGGMGVVWVAHSLVLGVDIALKLIRASVAGPAVSSRMAREAHAAARLGHPAMVRVFDFGWTSRGDPYLVMELVLGETLAAALEREVRIPAIRAVQTLLPIADGLRLAHDKSIIHRDIKPENIFLSTEALGRLQPKLLDFGIAKIGRNTRDSRLTQIGVVLGSPEYMSPEQAQGVDDIDERTDVWSLCVVLYETVTGTTPFKTTNYNALMQAVIHQPAMPITEFGVGDDALWRVLERGLAKDRAERWSNMTELGEALALWLYEHGIKEDLSGNSVRAVWLDMGLTGVRVDVPESTLPSSNKPKRTKRVKDDEDLEDLPQHLLLTDRPSASVTRAGRRTRRRRRKWLAIAASTLAVAAAVGGWFALRPHAKTTVATAPEPSMAAPSRAVASPAPASGTGGDSASARDEAARVAGIPMLRALPSNEAAAASSAAPPAPARATRRALVPGKPPANSGKRSHDFGF
jgi:eukaryotic-like serine/threonine-protein kinase